MDPSSNHDGGYTTTDVSGLCPVEECTLKVDIRLVSGDSIILGAHTKNLAFFGIGFPSLPGPKSEDSVIRLEEEAEVLQLLLRFMHNTRQPDLSLIPFSQLFSLAEAAEKYLVYSAMEICKFQMERYTHQDPIGVWIYAVKYDYQALANTTATLTLDFLPTKLLLRAKEHKVKDASIMQWLRFREQWHLLFMLVLKRQEYSCEHWGKFQFNVITDIGDRLTALRDFDEIVKKHRDKLQKDCCLKWRKKFGCWSPCTWSLDISEKKKDLKLYSHCVQV